MPMDPLYPEDWMRYIMEDAGMRVLVTESVHVGVVSGLGVENVEVVLCVDDDHSMYDGMDLERRVCPWNVGYLIYTSGSTGFFFSVIEQRSSQLSHIKSRHPSTVAGQPLQQPYPDPNPQKSSVQ